MPIFEAQKKGNEDCHQDAFNPLSAKPSFQLWYPGGQR